jgi:hypothetical protein
MQPKGRDPVRRPGIGPRDGQPARAAVGLRQRPADPRHLLRPADVCASSSAASVEPGGPTNARIRPRLPRSVTAKPAVRRPVGGRRAPSGVDEPWRQGHRNSPAGFRRSSPSATARPSRSDRRRERRYYGTQFHPEVVHTPDGAKLIANFARHVCGCRRMDHGRVPRRQDRRDPRAGRRPARDLRPVGRRRQRGRGGADPRGDRRAADLRLRRPRPDAHGRGASRSSACSATITISRWSCRRRGRCSWRASPASPTPRRSASSSAANSSMCSRKKRRRSAAPISSRRARSTPT